MVGSILAVAVVLIVFFHQQTQHIDWSLVDGTITATRIIPDHAWQTNWGSQVTYRAEYKVVYSVAGHSYATWADSGLRGESDRAVQLQIPQSFPHCRVEYDPKKPSRPKRTAAKLNQSWRRLRTPVPLCKSL